MPVSSGIGPTKPFTPDLAQDSASWPTLRPADDVPRYPTESYYLVRRANIGRCGYFGLSAGRWLESRGDTVRFV